MYLSCPPSPPPPIKKLKKLHNLCFSLLLGIIAVPRGTENNAYAKFGGGGGGGGKKGAFWDMCKWRIFAGNWVKIRPAIQSHSAIRRTHLRRISKLGQYKPSLFQFVDAYKLLHLGCSHGNDIRRLVDGLVHTG